MVAMLESLNARFYALCARFGIVPPVGEDGPPPVPAGLQREYDAALGAARAAFATGQLDADGYHAAVVAAHRTLNRGLLEALCPPCR